ncbi:MAG: coproporphyrinogen III oxidase family protein, partial [Calditerrivibrio sp.]|nr:coproporphyrinogen III oxidase family protein [Calditerrivibrio sp.]
IYKYFNVEVTEFTVEMNPESVSVEKLKCFHEAKVTRVSLGVQSMDDEVLSFLGRVHKSVDVLKALDSISSMGFSINCDLIYDIPTVSENDIFSSINKLLVYPVDHLSCYNYTFDTPFLEEFKMVEMQTQMEYVIDYLADKGFYQYEISNFSRKGKESKHNMKYWRMEDYIGIGISAHGMENLDRGRIRYSNEGTIGDYLEEKHVKKLEYIHAMEALLEDIVFGIRMVEGVDLNKLVLKYGRDMVDKIMNDVKIIEDEGLICYMGAKLCLTKRGQLFLDYVQQFFWDRFYS